MTLLLVDDSRTALFHLESLLADAGYADVRTVLSGGDALQMLAGELGERVDLVLLDMLMPDLDGVETCRRLKADERLRDVPVIMVTAETETSQLAAALDAVAIDYIVKPANEVELLARVRSALRLKRETDTRKERERVIESQRRLLEDDLARSSSFVTLFHARVTLATGRVEYVDAGHGYAYVRRADGATEPLAAAGAKGLPLGVLAGETYHPAEVTLQPGDTLIVFSDGLAEERASDDVFAALGPAPIKGAREVAQLLGPLEDDPAGDDVTVLALHRQR